MNDMSKEGKETPKLYPLGYDSSGKSLYYNDNNTTRADYALKLDRSRHLRFGSAAELDVVDIASPRFPDIQSPSYALKEYIRTSYGEREIPVYIFDDHNHALFAWLEALNEGKIENGATLYHYDDHDDAKFHPALPTDNSLKSLATYAKAIPFDEFIDPAVKMGLIAEMYWLYGLQDRYHKEGEKKMPPDEYGLGYTITGATALESKLEKVKTNPKKVIVDIDLDYFGKTQEDAAWEEEQIKLMKKAMTRAGVITFAISPGFLDERRAIELIRKLLE